MTKVFLGRSVRSMPILIPMQLEFRFLRMHSASTPPIGKENLVLPIVTETMMSSIERSRRIPTISFHSSNLGFEGMDENDLCVLFVSGFGILSSLINSLFTAFKCLKNEG